MPDTVDTVLRAPDDGWKYHPKHVEQLTDINKLYAVASCRIIIAINYRRFVVSSRWLWSGVQVFKFYTAKVGNGQEMLAIIRCRIFCLPGCYPKI